MVISSSIQHGDEKGRMRDSGGANMNIHDIERGSLEIAEYARG